MDHVFSQAYHLKVINTTVDAGQHLLPLLWRLWTRVQRRTEPSQTEQRTLNQQTMALVSLLSSSPLLNLLFTM